MADWRQLYEIKKQLGAAARAQGFYTWAECNAQIIMVNNQFGAEVLFYPEIKPVGKGLYSIENNTVSYSGVARFGITGAARRLNFVINLARGYDTSADNYTLGVVKNNKYVDFSFYPEPARVNGLDIVSQSMSDDEVVAYIEENADWHQWITRFVMDKRSEVSIASREFYKKIPDTFTLNNRKRSSYVEYGNFVSDIMEDYMVKAEALAKKMVSAGNVALREANKTWR